MTMRIFVIGSEGQVARSLRELSKGVRGMEIRCSSRASIDISRPDSIEQALGDFTPDIVVNPAAYTAVDRAESEADLAFAINRDGAGNVARAAKRLNVPIIHLSTDYVFDGRKPGSYIEADPVNPQSVYGRSKLAGELAVAAANQQHVILRTSWVYAPFGSNFVKTMLRLASERDRLSVVDDQFGCPTYAPDIAKAIVSIALTVKTRTWQSEFAGVTHLAGPDRTTWYEFARNIMQYCKAKGTRAAEVDPITTADYPTAATRPANSSLNCNRLQSTFNLRLPALPISLNDCLDRLLAIPSQETTP
jgi:dTDP-4-dehydrorhamnose reductase